MCATVPLTLLASDKPAISHHMCILDESIAKKDMFECSLSEGAWPRGLGVRSNLLILFEIRLLLQLLSAEFAAVEFYWLPYLSLFLSHRARRYSSTFYFSTFAFSYP